MPVFDSGFFSWYVEYVIKPLSPLTGLMCNNWGVEAAWCMAALDYARRVLK